MSSPSRMQRLMGPVPKTRDPHPVDREEVNRTVQVRAQSRIDAKASVEIDCHRGVAAVANCTQTIISNHRLRQLLEIPIINRYFNRSEGSVEYKLKELDSLFNNSAETMRRIDSEDAPNTIEQARTIVNSFLRELPNTQQILKKTDLLTAFFELPNEGLHDLGKFVDHELRPDTQISEISRFERIYTVFRAAEIMHERETTAATRRHFEVVIAQATRPAVKMQSIDFSVSYKITRRIVLTSFSNEQKDALRTLLQREHQPAITQEIERVINEITEQDSENFEAEIESVQANNRGEFFKRTLLQAASFVEGVDNGKSFSSLEELTSHLRLGLMGLIHYYPRS